MLLASSVASAMTAKITAHQLLNSTEYQRSLDLEFANTTIRLMLNPSYVTANTSIHTEGQPGTAYTDKLFTGIVDGEKDSWVRVSMSQNNFSGVLSRGGNRFEMRTDRFGRIKIKPLADNHEKHVLLTTVDGRTILNSRQNRVTRIAKIAIVVDSQYNDTYNGAGVDKALSIINAVDGIYREEFGLGLKVVQVLSFVDRNSDPFNYGPVPIELMLRNFRDYRLNSDEFVDASLVHLFTGNENTDEPVGLAWIDTACRTDGYDVGISTPYRHDILLTAHEIAHNLGAKHDSETACSSQTDKVMWPYISSNTSQYFSSCTLESVNESLQNSCHTETIDLQVTVSRPENNNDTVTATVTNNDYLRSNPSAVLSIDYPASSTATALEGDCQQPDNNLECSIGTLLPGAQETIVVQFDQIDEFDSVVSFTVDNENSADPAPQNNHVAMDIREGLIVVSDSTDVFFTGAGGNAGAERKVGAGTLSPTTLCLMLLLLARLMYNNTRNPGLHGS